MFHLRLMLFSLTLCMAAMSELQAQQLASPRDFKVWPSWSTGWAWSAYANASWSGVRGAASYEIEFTPYAGNQTGRPFVKTTRNTSYSLLAGSPPFISSSGYRIRVRAVSPTGAKGAYTAYQTCNIN